MSLVPGRPQTVTFDVCSRGPWHTTYHLERSRVCRKPGRERSGVRAPRRRHVLLAGSRAGAGHAEGRGRVSVETLERAARPSSAPATSARAFAGPDAALAARTRGALLHRDPLPLAPVPRPCDARRLHRRAHVLRARAERRGRQRLHGSRRGLLLPGCRSSAAPGAGLAAGRRGGLRARKDAERRPHVPRRLPGLGAGAAVRPPGPAFGVAVATVAGGAMLYHSYLTTEAAAYPIYLLAVAVCIRALAVPSHRWDLAAVLVLGLAVLTRAQFVALPIVFVVAVLVVGRPLRRHTVALACARRPRRTRRGPWSLRARVLRRRGRVRLPGARDPALVGMDRRAAPVRHRVARRPGSDPRSRLRSRAAPQPRRERLRRHDDPLAGRRTASGGPHRVRGGAPAVRALCLLRQFRFSSPRSSSMSSEARRAGCSTSAQRARARRPRSRRALCVARAGPRSRSTRPRSPPSRLLVDVWVSATLPPSSRPAGWSRRSRRQRSAAGRSAWPVAGALRRARSRRGRRRLRGRPPDDRADALDPRARSARLARPVAESRVRTMLVLPGGSASCGLDARVLESERRPDRSTSGRRPVGPATASRRSGHRRRTPRSRTAASRLTRAARGLNDYGSSVELDGERSRARVPAWPCTERRRRARRALVRRGRVPRRLGAAQWCATASGAASAGGVYRVRLELPAGRLPAWSSSRSGPVASKNVALEGRESSRRFPPVCLDADSTACDPHRKRRLRGPR